PVSGGGQGACCGFVVGAAFEEGVGAELGVRGLGVELCRGGEHEQSVPVLGVSGGCRDAHTFAGASPVAGVAGAEQFGPSVGGGDVGPVGAVLVVVAGGGGPVGGGRAWACGGLGECGRLDGGHGVAHAREFEEVLAHLAV